MGNKSNKRRPKSRKLIHKCRRLNYPRPVQQRLSSTGGPLDKMKQEEEASRLNLSLDENLFEHVVGPFSQQTPPKSTAEISARLSSTPLHHTGKSSAFLQTPKDEEDMAVVRWDKFHQELLIEKVRLRNCLWDIRHPDYRNVNKKQALFEEIASEMESVRPGTGVEEVKKRWGNLRCQFSENIRASKGKDGGPDKPRKLWCKDILMFLNEVTVPRSNKIRKVVEGVDGELSSSGGEPLASELEAGDVVEAEECCFSEKHKLACGLEPLTGAALPPLRTHNLDAIDKYAHCVASELRQIRQPQQLVLAKWHIQNILFQAQFGMLVGPPATLAFSSGPSPYPQEAIVNWQQTAPIQVIASEADQDKDSPS